MKINKRKISAFVFLVAIAVGVFSFQNCAPPKNNSSFQSSTAGLQGGVSPSSFAESQTYSVGRCGTAVNTCDDGVFVNEPDTNVSVWSCIGTKGGASVRCNSNFSNTPVPGICSSSLNQCLQGQSVDVANTVANQEKWECRGFNGGATTTCTLNIIPNLPKIDGVCGTNAYTCNPGQVVRNVTPPTGSTDLLWTCNGVNGGAPAPQVCKFSNADPNAPLCGSDDATCLNNATVSEVTDSGTSFLWQCTKPGYPAAACTLSKPSCILSVEPRTHYNETFTYRMTVASGALPSSVTVKYYGTKAGLDGSNVVTDATGSAQDTMTNVRTNPFQIPIVNPGGSFSGNYTRSFALINPRTNKELCRTNIVNQVLTPRCDLTFDKATLDTTQTLTATFNFAVAGQPLLPYTPNNIVWFGTKNSTEDERGQTIFGLSTTAGVGTKTFGPFAEGSYQRYFVAVASNGMELCKSTKANYTVTNVPLVNGLCEDANHPLATDTCALGRAIEIGAPGDSTSQNIWKCEGAGGGQTVSCSTPKNAVTNLCATFVNEAANNCVTGATKINQTYNCTTGKFNWTCQQTGTNLTSPCEYSSTPNNCPVTDPPATDPTTPDTGGGFDGGAGTCSSNEVISIQFLSNANEVCR